MPSPSCAPASTSAREAGCSEWRASAPAQASACACETPARVCTPCTHRRSRLRVPVLSNTTVSTCASASKACRRRTNIPPPARRPAAASMAAGVASDRAQGQVTTNTDTATISARSGSLSHHHRAAPAALSITPTKNGLARRSASSASVGLVLEAASIRATIWAKRVLSATRCTRTQSVEPRLKLPASTCAPTPRGRGRDSPVSSASSTLLAPCSTTPSAAKDSPLCTRSRSPTAMRRTATRSKLPSAN